MTAQRSPTSAVRLTAIMCSAEAASMTGFAAFTSLLPLMQREWGLSNSEAGLISGVFYAGYMAAVPVLTSLTDRVDSRRIYAGRACSRSQALPASRSSRRVCGRRSSSSS